MNTRVPIVPGTGPMATHDAHAEFRAPRHPHAGRPGVAGRRPDNQMSLSLTTIR